MTETTPTWWQQLQAGLDEAGAALWGAVDVEEVVASHEWHDVCVRLDAWLAEGNHGQMHWLAREEAVATRMDPRTRYPWIRSALAVAFPYDTLQGRDAAVSLGEGVVEPAERGRAKISRYAHGVDYHWLLGKRLLRLVKQVGRAHPGVQLRYYLDTGPVLERQWAERAGLGWLGKNGLLLHPQLGSYFFLSVIFCSEPTPEEARRPRVPDRCGTCTRCIEACPTDALAYDGSGKLDARRCLSYLTIEARNEPASELLAEHHHGWLFGCDICQQVCPWTRKAPLTQTTEFEPWEVYESLTPQQFAQQSAELFRQRFRKSPLWRPGQQKLNATLGLLAPTRSDSDNSTT